MRNLFFQIGSRIRYLCSAKHRKGHGIHSPYVYHFLNYVLYEKSSYYCYDAIERYRKQYAEDKRFIQIPALGTGIERRERICDIAEKSVKSAKYSQLLFRIALHLDAKTIIELGSSLGLTTLYLASARLKSQVYTFEGAPSICELSSKLYSSAGFTSIHQLCGDIDYTLPELLSKVDTVDLAFVDANHTYNSTISYYNQLKSKRNDHSIFVFDDIHWSKEMQMAWEYICADDEVHCLIDIYGMGIVFFNSDLPKQSYVISF